MNSVLMQAPSGAGPRRAAARSRLPGRLPPLAKKNAARRQVAPKRAPLAQYWSWLRQQHADEAVIATFQTKQAPPSAHRGSLLPPAAAAATIERLYAEAEQHGTVAAVLRVPLLRAAPHCASYAVLQLMSAALFRGASALHWQHWGVVDVDTVRLRINFTADGGGSELAVDCVTLAAAERVARPVVAAMTAALAKMDAMRLAQLKALDADAL